MYPTVSTWESVADQILVNTFDLSLRMNGMLTDLGDRAVPSVVGAGMTVTSAMKGLAPTVKTMLAAVQSGSFASMAGKVENLGLVSANPDDNYVQLPSATTQFGDGFTAEDYANLVADMFAGKITVSNDTSIAAADNAKVITVNDQGNLK